MARRRHCQEQSIWKPREADVLLGMGETVAMVARMREVTEHNYNCWRRRYGSLKVDQAKKIKKLERENERLQRIVVD